MATNPTVSPRPAPSEHDFMPLNGIDHVELWVGNAAQAAYFFTQRQTTGFVFCLFFFFENWLYTATYMADARAMELPLVTTGDPDFVAGHSLGEYPALVAAGSLQFADALRLVPKLERLGVAAFATRTVKHARASTRFAARPPIGYP